MILVLSNQHNLLTAQSSPALQKSSRGCDTHGLSRNHKAREPEKPVASLKLQGSFLIKRIYLHPLVILLKIPIPHFGIYEESQGRSISSLKYVKPSSQSFLCHFSGSSAQPATQSQRPYSHTASWINPSSPQNPETQKSDRQTQNRLII